jgi:hypothetical protein
MNSPLPPSDTGTAPRRSFGRRLVNVLVALVVVVVAAAVFVFSYDGVHAIALLGGMSTRLARYYPALFDAVLVIACIAVALLRGRWWARLWAWLIVLVLLAAIGAADVLHAADYALRHRPTEEVVAGAPVVAVLLAFSLLLTLLRQPRRRRAVADYDDYRDDRRAVAAPPLPALSAAPTAPGSAVALANAPTVERPALTAAEQEGRWSRSSAGPIALPAAPAAPSVPSEPAEPDEPADLEAGDAELADGGDGPVLEEALPRRRFSDYPVPGRTAEVSPPTPPDGLPVLRRPAQPTAAQPTAAAPTVAPAVAAASGVTEAEPTVQPRPVFQPLAAEPKSPEPPEAELAPASPAAAEPETAEIAPAKAEPTAPEQPETAAAAGEPETAEIAATEVRPAEPEPESVPAAAESRPAAESVPAAAAETGPGEPETAEIPAVPAPPGNPPTAPSRALTVEPEPAAEPTAAAPAAPETAAAAAEPVAAEPVAAEPAAAEAESAAPEPAAPARSGIRYASRTASGSASPPPAAEPPPPPAPESRVAGPQGYWETENGSPFAGLVYSAHEEGPADGAADGSHAVDGQPGGHRETPAGDEDAPPFASAPVSFIPGFNRVRSMPTPPGDDEER